MHASSYHNDIFVGRQAQLARLHQALEQAGNGGTAFVVVEGEPGSGKSMLVRRFLRQAREFAPVLIGEGTFRATPEQGAHAALDNAFSEALCSVLSLPEAEVRRWKHRIRHALGEEADALCRVVRGLRPFFDTIPPASTLEPAESFQRVKHLFSRLAPALSSDGVPFVLF
ncbi:MAG: AAA family ATPase, partial [Chitinivibrionales bacterium]|nr:AAA family ATPase [Chitinivibrionales bacterium]